MGGTYSAWLSALASGVQGAQGKPVPGKAGGPLQTCAASLVTYLWTGCQDAEQKDLPISPSSHRFLFISPYFSYNNGKAYFSAFGEI